MSDKNNVNVIKKDYVLSIWIEQRGVDSPQFEEKELMVIGTDADESPVRAFNPKLKRDANGNKTLTFEMFLRYYDEDLGDTYENPFCQYLKSETHLKLKTGGKWYDFVIKDIDEDSTSKKITYTAKDYFVNELSKNGYSLDFRTDKRNNIGTAPALAKKVLEDTDWTVSSKSEMLYQTVDQPLFRVIFSSAVPAQLIEEPKPNLSVSSQVINETEANRFENPEVVKGCKRIYVKECFAFYKDVSRRYQLETVDSLSSLAIRDGGKEADWQIILPTVGSGGANSNAQYQFERDDGNNIKVEFEEETFIAGTQCIISHEVLNDQKRPEVSFVSDIRAKALVQSDDTFYDPVTDQCVRKYKESNDHSSNPTYYYAYEKVTEEAPGLVNNLLPYSGNFTSTKGWTLKSDTGQQNDGLIELQSRDDGTYLYFNYNRTYYILQNDLSNARSSFEGLQKGDVFYFRIKGITPAATIRDKSIKSISIKIDGNTVINFSTNSLKIDSKGYIWTKGVCNLAYSEQTLNTKNNFVLEIECVTTNQSRPFYVSEFQLFRESRALIPSYEDSLIKKNYLIAPNGYLQLDNWDWGKWSGSNQPFYQYGDTGWELSSDSPTFAPEAVVSKKYYFYKEPKIGTQAKDIVYTIYDKIPFNYTQVLSSSNRYEKVKAIEQSETNRMDILSKICETFQCWLDFDIERDIDGRIKKKSILFKHYLNRQKCYGFSYGFNLNSVKRKVDSNQIASKIIVKPNSNQYAPNGSCTIQEAADNPTGGETFFYNFDYYINNGMLPKDQVTRDVFISFYPAIRSKNYQLKELTMKLASYNQIMDSVSSSVQQYRAARDSAKERIEKYDQSLQALTRQLAQTDSPNYPNGLTWQQCRNDTNCWNAAAGAGGTTYLNELAQSQSVYNAMIQSLPSLEKQYEDYTKEMQNLEKMIEEKQQEKQEYIRDFEKGYMRFIQEGAWTSEDYTDPNLYYYDAEATLYESSRPKIEYTFDVADISVLDDFSEYKFDVGDKTWVEDTEFFGWVYDEFSTRVRPYREEVVVYEYEEDLDDPRKDKITIKTFKSQFEDLFQRIGSTVNQLEFKTGAYNRVAGLVNSNGTITNMALENSFLENASIVQNGINQAVTKGANGVTITSTSSPNEIVKLVSGGIVLSEDGGKTWRTGITGHGISADKITAGVINTSEIALMNGTDTSFSWTSDGIKAFRATGYSKFSNQGLEIWKYGDNNTSTRVFYTDDNGNLNITGQGKITVENGGKIGGWNISSSQIAYAGNGSTDGYELNKYNYVFGVFQPVGYTLSAGNETGGLYSDKGNDLFDFFRRQGIDRVIFQCGGYTKNETDPTKTTKGCFAITPGGNIYANNGYFSGEVVANSGSIGGWQIKDSGLVFGETTKDNILIQVNGDDPNSHFYVTQDGVLHANGADIQGTITASVSSIGGWTTIDGILQSSNGSIKLDSQNNIITVGDIELLGGAGGSISVKNEGSIQFGYGSLGSEGITANSGTIGGWDINATQLQTSDGTTILSAENGIICNKGKIGGWVISEDGLSSPNKEVIFNCGTNGNPQHVEITGDVVISGGLTANYSSAQQSQKTVQPQLVYQKNHIIAPDFPSQIYSSGTGYTIQNYNSTASRFTIFAAHNNSTDQGGIRDTDFFVDLFSPKNLDDLRDTKHQNSAYLTLETDLANMKKTSSRIALGQVGRTQGQEVTHASIIMFPRVSENNQSTMSGNLVTEGGGKWQYNGKEIATTTSDSDQRLKNSISKINLSDSIFDSIIPYQFKFNNSELAKIHFGFIAQNVREVLQKSGWPLEKFFLISENEDGYYELAYQEFIAILWEQVQKLKAEVRILKNKFSLEQQKSESTSQ